MRQGSSHNDGAGARTPTRRQLISSLFAASVVAPYALGQSRGSDRGDLAEGYRRRSEAMEKAGLAEPFKGITTNGIVIPDLYNIAPTRRSTDSVHNAAVCYMATLSDQQLVRTMFPVDDPQWRKWMNQGYYVREGVSMREMTTAQRNAALGLMRAGADRP